MLRKLSIRSIRKSILKNTGLMKAAEEGDNITVRRLLSKGHEVDETDDEGATALHYAARSGQSSIVLILLDADSNIMAVTNDGSTALSMCCASGDFATAQLLVDRGAYIDATDKNGRNSLFLACSNGHTVTAEMLLHRGGSLDRRTASGATALHIACERGHLDTAEMLLERGADPHARDNLGATPLFRASFCGHGEIVKLLIAHGADVQALDSDGRSALDLAVNVTVRNILGTGLRGCVEAVLSTPQVPTSTEEEEDKAEYVLVLSSNEDTTSSAIATEDVIPVDVSLSLKDIWEDEEWETVNLQLEFYIAVQKYEEQEDGQDHKMLEELRVQNVFLATCMDQKKMVPWSLSKLTKRSTSLAKALQERMDLTDHDDVDDSAQSSMRCLCSNALIKLKERLNVAHIDLLEPVHSMGPCSFIPPITSPTITTFTHPAVVDVDSDCTESEGVAEAPEDCTAHRLVDEGVVEDGSFRSPLSGLFPTHLPVLSLSLCLLPLMSEKPYLEISRKIAEKHAVSIDKSKVAGLTLDEVSAIVLYTMEEIPKENSVYFMMNAALRSLDRSSVRPWRDYIWLLLKALQKLPPAPCDSVYRGMGVSLDALGRHYGKGCEFQWASFSSTTSHIDVLEAFVGPSGPRSLFHLKLTAPLARDIRDFSLFPKENELLLPPNVLFVVDALLNLGNELCILQCTQVETIDVLLQL